jgi:hypothetical protein
MFCTLASGIEALPYLTVPTAVWQPSITGQPGENLDYTFNLSPIWMQPGEQIAIASVAVAPSGTGELTCYDLSANGSVVTADFSSGVAGRAYVTLLTATTLTGRVIVVPIAFDFGAVLAPWPPSTPASWGFGTPTTWSSGATVFGPAIAAVNTGLILTGNSQATALPLLAAVNEISSAPTGTGGILPADIISGTIVVQDFDSSNNAQIYPPVGAQINAQAINAPYIVSSAGGRISFSTQSPLTQWFAG